MRPSQNVFGNRLMKGNKERKTERTTDGWLFNEKEKPTGGKKALMSQFATALQEKFRNIN